MGNVRSSLSVKPVSYNLNAITMGIELLFPLEMYHFYIFAPAPATCTNGGNECDNNPDGLTVCPVGGGNCKGKSIIYTYN